MRVGVVAVALCAIAFGCDPSPVGVDLPTPGVQASLLEPPHKLGFMPCAALTSVSVTQVIGRKGGSLKVGPANCDVGDGSRLAYLQIVYKHGHQIVEYEPSVRDLARQTVTGEISHFSGYAVAW